MEDGGSPSREMEVYPPGVGEFFGVDDMGRGWNRQSNPAEPFLTIHPENPNRFWAEVYFHDENDLMEHVRVLSTQMAALGIVHMPTLMAIKLAGRLSVQGYARGQALQATIGTRNLFSRMKDSVSNIFRFGDRRQNSLPQG
jgi:hypothetical protein